MILDDDAGEIMRDAESSPERKAELRRATCRAGELYAHGS